MSGVLGYSKQNLVLGADSIHFDRYWLQKPVSAFISRKLWAWGGFLGSILRITAYEFCFAETLGDPPRRVES